MTAFRLPDGGRIDRSQKLRFRFDWTLTHPAAHVGPEAIEFPPRNPELFADIGDD